MSKEVRDSGFILLHRRLRGHWLWQDAERLKWWIDILMECNHEDNKVLIGQTLMDCARGQSLNSLWTWARSWRVDVGVVRRYMRVLENDGMIRTENLGKTTRLTVCNYDTYNYGPALKRIDNESQTTRERIQTNNVQNKEYTYSEEELKKFSKFEKWLKENAPQLLQVKEPFTIKQYLEITEEFGIEYRNRLLLQMHNKAGFAKKYVSANLTFRSWARRDKEKNKEGDLFNKQPNYEARLKNLN